MLKRVVTLLVTVAMLVSITVVGACAEEAQYTIGLLVPSFSNQGFVIAREAAEAKAQELNIELVPLGAQDETSIEEQIQCMEDLIARDVDAIVFSPASSTGIVDVLLKAQQAGIPLVNFDSRVDAEAAEEAGLAAIPYVGANNEEGAYMSAQYLIEVMGGSGKVCIIEGLPGHFNNEVRKAGALKAFEEADGIEVVTVQAAYWETEGAMDLLTNILTANTDITGVFACNDTMAWGCSAAISSLGLTGKVHLTCFDGLMDTLPYIEEGTIDATLDQRLDEQASIGLELAVKLLNGEEVAETTDAHVRLWTADSIKEIFE